MDSEESIFRKIKEELNVQLNVIPADRVSGIEHYLKHSEIGMAFEFFCLEAMERNIELRFLNKDFLMSTALYYGLNYDDNCMIDGDFWAKFTKWIGSS